MKDIKRKLAQNPERNHHFTQPFSLVLPRTADTLKARSPLVAALLVKPVELCTLETACRALFEGFSLGSVELLHRHCDSTHMKGAAGM
jgi:hypothetical protein